jgi:hypothetical protein
MILIAVSLYLPEHILTVTRRAFYYYSGAPETPPRTTLQGVADGALALGTAESIAKGKNVVVDGLANGADRLVGAAKAAGAAVTDKPGLEI